jgi:hypothetical protein
VATEKRVTEERMKAAIAWFNKQFTADIAKAIQEMPFPVDFLTALALQESYEVWGRAYQIKTVPEVLELCVGDISDASSGRNPHAFPQNRAVLERAPGGREMFKIARHAFECMTEVAPSTRNTLKNKNKFCHALGIIQYDIQAFTHDSDYFFNWDWRDFSKCLAKCLMELNASWAVLIRTRRNYLTRNWFMLRSLIIKDTPT